MTQPKTNRVPAPLYAAAGAGELALRQLRKLPTVVGELGSRVVTDLGGKAAADFDLAKLREAATRNAAAVRAGAQAAQARAERAVAETQERALTAYAELVARGERVVGAGVLGAAETVNADIEATEADRTPTVEAGQPAEVPSPAEMPSPAEVVEAVEVIEVTGTAEAKPVAAKRTRAAKATGRTRRTAE